MKQTVSFEWQFFTTSRLFFIAILVTSSMHTPLFGLQPTFDGSWTYTSTGSEKSEQTLMLKALDRFLILEGIDMCKELFAISKLGSTDEKQIRLAATLSGIVNAMKMSNILYYFHAKEGRFGHQAAKFGLGKKWFLSTYVDGYFTYQDFMKFIDSEMIAIDNQDRDLSEQRYAQNAHLFINSLLNFIPLIMLRGAMKESNCRFKPDGWLSYAVPGGILYLLGRLSEYLRKHERYEIEQPPTKSSRLPRIKISSRDKKRGVAIDMKVGESLSASIRLGDK